MLLSVVKRVAGGALLMLAGLAVAVGAAQAAGTLEKIKERGELLAGVRYDYPPIGVLGADGKPQGFGIDLAKLFADKLGVKVKYVQVTSKTRFAMLNNGNIDAEFGPTTPSVSRQEVVDFSLPYVWDGVVLLIKKGSSKKLADYAPPKKVALTQGSNIGDMIHEHVPSAKFVRFQEYTDAVVALKNDKVDGVGINKFTGLAMMKKNPELDISEDFFVDPWAITIRQDDTKWRVFVNVAMQELWQKGEYQKLYEQHFGVKPNFKMWSEFRLQPGVGAK